MEHGTGALDSIKLQVDTVRYYNMLALKQYELTNHLGNVLATVNDRKTPVIVSSALVGYRADVVSATYYYPFGSTMQTWGNDSSYKFGFNGKEKDNETYGEGNAYDFGARTYDSRLGKFLSADKFTIRSPFNSPYMFAGNTPVWGIDINGDSLYILTYTTGDQRGNDMFKAAALTRKYDIEHSGHFDPAKDKVVVLEIQDISTIKKLVEKTVKENSGTYGKTAEFSSWSHGGTDGPVGSVEAGSYNLGKITDQRADLNQMTLAGWGAINFNWSENANAYIYGCGTGLDPAGIKASFTTNISGLPNFKNVTVWGIDGAAFPSEYANVRNPTISQYNDNFNVGNQLQGKDKVYMIGGEIEDKKALFGLGTTHPMRKSINGKGQIKEGQFGPGDQD